MTMDVVDPDILSWHKRFAIDCNNRAWALTEQSRTPQQDREMLDAAHASAWHWARAGTELNHKRSVMLLAAVHASLGHGSLAYAYATEMREYFLHRETPDWELAFTHAIFAHAAHAAGRPDEHRQAYAETMAAVEAVADPEDKEVVLGTVKLVPLP